MQHARSRCNKGHAWRCRFQCCRSAIRQRTTCRNTYKPHGAQRQRLYLPPLATSSLHERPQVCNSWLSSIRGFHEPTKDRPFKTNPGRSWEWETTIFRTSRAPCLCAPRKTRPEKKNEKKSPRKMVLSLLLWLVRRQSMHEIYLIYIKPYQVYPSTSQRGKSTKDEHGEWPQRCTEVI